MVKKFSNYCVYIYCFVMFIIYPLFFKNGYYDIGIAKYDFFVVFHMVALLVMCPLILWKEKIEFSLLDKVVLVYLGSNMISAILSDYRSAAWRGSEDWYMGLFSQIIFVLIYFCIKNVGSIQTKRVYTVVWMALGGATIVFALGILNRFSVYPIDMKVEHTAFISTIGNINWFCGYWSIMACMGIGLYLISTGKMKLLCGSYCFVAILAGLVQGSASALLVFLGCGSILLWQAFNSKKEWLVLIELLAIGSLAMEAVFWLEQAFPKGMKYNNMFIKYLMNHHLGLMAFLIVCVTWLLVYFACPQYNVLNNQNQDNKKDKLCDGSKKFYNNVHEKNTKDSLYGIRLGFFAILILGVISALYSAMKSGLIVLDNNFGNGRIGIWMLCFELVKSMNMRQILFGVGPDCFSNYLYSFSDLVPKLTDMFGDFRLTNCHCEILNTFINVGLLGVLSYMAVWIIALRNFAGKLKMRTV